MGQMANLVTADQARLAKAELLRQLGENQNVNGVGIGGNPQAGHKVEVRLLRDDPDLVNRFRKIQGVPVAFQVVGEVRALE